MTKIRRNAIRSSHNNRSYRSNTSSSGFDLVDKNGKIDKRIRLANYPLPILTQTKRNELLSLVQLYKALGGWQQ